MPPLETLAQWFGWGCLGLILISAFGLLVIVLGEGAQEQRRRSRARR